MSAEELPPLPWRPRKRRRPARPALSTEAIVAAALRVLRAEGLDAVTMRRVADELDTGAASLYVHVADKDELHSLMLDEVVGQLRLPEPRPNRWQEQVKEVARDMLRLLEDNGFEQSVYAGQGMDESGVAERIAQMRTYLTSLPAERFPNVVALAVPLTTGGGDERFEFGLDLLVRGLAATVR